MPNTFNKPINRIIDANINRTKEGLRVCEEIARFLLNNRRLTTELKKIRHKIYLTVKKLPISAKEIIESRDSAQDLGRNIYINELQRKNYQDIFFANMQRIKESLRVLEEFSKLTDKGSARKFKRIRYVIYEIEKEAVKKIAALHNL